MISITTVIHTNTKHNRQPQIHRRLRCSDTNAFINFWVRFFNTRRERILKSILYHTMLTTSFNGHNPTLCPYARNLTIIFHGPTSKSQLPGRTSISQQHCRTPLPTIMVGSQLQLSASMADNPTVCLHGPKSTPNWCVFQNLQILRTIASRHDVIHTPCLISYLGFIMTIVIVISFAREHKLHPMLYTWTKSWIVQSPT